MNFRIISVYEHRINALSYIDYEFNAKSQEALRCRCGESSIIAL